MAVTIRVELPQHLRTLAHVGHEVGIEVEGPVTQRSVLDALEERYPMLKGAIRDHGDKAAPRLPALLRLPGRSDPRKSRRPSARPSSLRQRTLPDHRSNRRRLAASNVPNCG